MSAAGRSAAAEARAIRARARRGVWRRITALTGTSPEAARADAVAARWQRGADAERATARLLHGLRWRGWRILHDRRLPGHGRANIDHVLVSPCGTAVVVLDTKAWHRSWSTDLLAGRVHCGSEDRHGEVEKVARYTGTVGRLLGLHAGAVWPMLVVHGSPVAGGVLDARVAGWDGPVWVLGADRLVAALVAAPSGWSVRRAAVLRRRVAGVLPPYRG
ncbi:nuclease-related domain-containing protein [Streptomyces sp. NPDC090499]|uniref:nuclease-related domain-containing protein n=1 Tax=Streptomyces sp. NPDC090499 TaxID=3365965 RepID=UPI003805A242